MKALIKQFVVGLLVMACLAAAGCVSCLPRYPAPPTGPPSACYPAGHDPYIPMDHNPSPFNFWDLFRGIAAPFVYGPPR